MAGPPPPSPEVVTSQTGKSRQHVRLPVGPWILEGTSVVHKYVCLLPVSEKFSNSGFCLTRGSSSGRRRLSTCREGTREQRFGWSGSRRLSGDKRYLPDRRLPEGTLNRLAAFVPGWLGVSTSSGEPWSPESPEGEAAEASSPNPAGVHPSRLSKQPAWGHNGLRENYE